MKQLPASFFLFVGENYCDSENWNSRYGKASAGAEYGISWADFVNEQYENAVLDGEDQFNNMDDSSKHACLVSFVESSRRSIQSTLNNIQHVEASISANAERSHDDRA